MSMSRNYHNKDLVSSGDLDLETKFKLCQKESKMELDETAGRFEEKKRWKYSRLQSSAEKQSELW